jgi:hypothetical protein
MPSLKQAWVTPLLCSHQDLFSISLESEHVTEEFRRIHQVENVFPAEPTPEPPLRHVMVISVLDLKDIVTLRDALNKICYQYNVDRQ